MTAPLRITLRRRDRRVLTGFAPGFNPGDGSVMVAVAPRSPAGTMVSLDQVEILVMQPTDGAALPLPPTRKDGSASPAVRITFANRTIIVGESARVAPGTGVWMRPLDDAFGLAFVPEGAARYVSLLEDVPETTEDLWAFLNDSTPTDEVEVPEVPMVDSGATTQPTEISTGPTSVTKAVDPRSR